MLEEVGFEEVVQIRYDVPLNAWVPDPELKKLGGAAYSHIVFALRPISMSTIGSGLGWAAERVDALIGEVRKDLENTDFHCYVQV